MPSGTRHGAPRTQYQPGSAEISKCAILSLMNSWAALLPLWHRCNINFYLAGVARVSRLPQVKFHLPVIDLRLTEQLGQNHLRETLHYLQALKDIRRQAGKAEDPAYTNLQKHTENLMIELEADVLEANDKKRMEMLEQQSNEPSSAEKAEDRECWAGIHSLTENIKKNTYKNTNQPPDSTTPSDTKMGGMAPESTKFSGIEMSMSSKVSHLQAASLWADHLPHL